MNYKRLFAGLITGAFVFTCCTAGFIAGAKTQAVNPQNKSYAWLDDLYVRESSTQYTLDKLIPVTDYPYSRTCAEFKTDVRNSLDFHPADGSTIEENYNYVLSQANSIMIAMGASGSYEDEKQWLESQAGIVYPGQSGEYDLLYTNVLYGALKYNMFKTLYGKELVIPRGTTLEKAIVIFIHTVTDSDNSISIGKIDTVKEYGLAAMRERLIADGHFDVDENTSDEDIYRYTSILFIRNAGYTIDNDATDEQISAYYYVASVWRTYGVKVQPAEMAAALEAPVGERENDVQMLILKTMAEEKGTSLPASATVETAFKKALELGYFKLGNGFYSDIYNYRVNLAYNRSSVWITPLSFAYKLPYGSSRNAVIKINGNTAADKMPAKVSLDSSKAQQTVEITVKYTNGSTVQSKNYKITFIQGKSAAPSTTSEDPDNELTTYNTSSTLPYVTSFEGSTYYIGGLETLPDGANVITDENGTVIGVDDSGRTSDDGNSGGETGSADSADTSSASLAKRLSEKLPVIALTAGLLLSAAAAGFLMVKKKGGKN